MIFLGGKSPKIFKIGEKYQIHMKTKVSKKFFTPNSGLGQRYNVYFYLTRSKQIEKVANPNASINSGKSFIK